jgi:hypothetical protein
MNTSMIDSTSLTEAKQAEPDELSFVARCRKLCESAPFYSLLAAWQDRRVATLRGILLGFAVLVVGQSGASFAGAAPAPRPAIAVLDFELHDLTLIPGMAEELERTASIGPLLQQILKTQYGFELVAIDSATQDAADEAFGYLFDHHDVAAELGREAASDWIVVGRVHKASFLFVYLIAQVIDTKTHRLIADLIVEIKGPQKRLTIKGVETLARQIAAAIDATQLK